MKTYEKHLVLEAFQELGDGDKEAIDKYVDTLTKKLFKDVKKDVKKNKWPDRINNYVLGRIQFYIDKPGMIGKLGHIIKGKH